MAKDFVQLPSKLPCYSIPNILDRKDPCVLFISYILCDKEKKDCCDCSIYGDHDRSNMRFQ